MNTSGTMRVKPLGILIIVAIFVFLYLGVFRGDSGGGSAVNSQNKRVSLERLMAVAIEAAVLGGYEVQKVRKMADLDQKSKGKTKEGVNDPVTAGDINSHRAMYSSLTGSVAGLKVISEEHDVSDYSRDRIASTAGAEFLPSVVSLIPKDEFLPLDELTVWIDPLDATKEYTENLLEYVTTMVCIARLGRPLGGVIHRPFQNETYWAWVGKGHSRNLNTKHDASGLPPKVVVSISHKGDVEKYVADKMGAGSAEVYDAAGAGYKTLEVIQGKADAYVHTTRIKKWDTCAGNALMAALGGSMTTLKGHLVDYSSGADVMIVDGLLASFHPEKFSSLMKD